MNERIKQLRDRRERYMRESLEILRLGQQGTPLQTLRTAFEAEWNALRTAVLNEIERDHIAVNRSLLDEHGVTTGLGELQVLQDVAAVRSSMEREVALETAVFNALIARHTQ